MSRLVCLAALIALAGCGRHELCGGAELEGVTCATVHVKGTLNDGVSTLDTLQVDITYRDTSFNTHIHRSVSRPDMPPDGGMVGLPLTFAVVWPGNARTGEFSDKLVVLARSGTRLAGLGALSPDEISIKSGQHGHLDVVLKPATGSCVSAGGCGLEDCPACGPGERCGQASRCIDGFVCSGSTTEICVPGT
jgi:hypothetical protein